MGVGPSPGAGATRYFEQVELHPTLCFPSSTAIHKGKLIMLLPILIPQAATLLYLATPAKGWQYSFPEAWSEQWQEVWQQAPTGDGKCTTSHLTAFEMAKHGE